MPRPLKKVEVIESGPGLVLARFYYDKVLAIRYRAEVDGAVYAATFAVLPGAFFIRVAMRGAEGRREMVRIARLVPEYLWQLADIIKSIKSLCDYKKLVRMLDSAKFCHIDPPDVYILCPSPELWEPCR